METKIESTLAKNANVEESLARFSDSLKALTKELQVTHQLDQNSFQKLFNSLEETISQLDKDIRNQTITKDKIEDLKRDYAMLQKLNEDLACQVDDSHAENKNLIEGLTVVKAELNEMQNAEESIKYELVRLNELVTAKKMELETCKAKAAESVSSFEVKMKAQQDLYRSVVEDLDNVRKDLEEARNKASDLGMLLTKSQASELGIKKKDEQMEKSQAETDRMMLALGRENATLKSKLEEFQRLAVQERNEMDIAQQRKESAIIKENSPLKTDHDYLFARAASQTESVGSEIKSPKAKGKRKRDPVKSKMTFIDAFDLDETLLNADVSFKPKRYTKRKKTRA